MAQAVRKALAADVESYDRARRKLVPCFDDFFRTARELLQGSGQAVVGQGDTRARIVSPVV
jgi:hypothetical protein